MRTTRGVNMMITRPPPLRCRVDPAFALEANLARACIHDDVPAFAHRFRAPRELERVGSVGKYHRLPFPAVYLRLERKIGGKAFGLGRINAALQIADHKSAQRGFATVIFHMKGERPRRSTIKENRHVTPKPEVLRSLSDVEGQRR